LVELAQAIAVWLIPVWWLSDSICNSYVSVLQRLDGADILNVSKTNFYSDPGYPTNKSVGKMVTFGGKND